MLKVLAAVSDDGARLSVSSSVVWLPLRDLCFYLVNSWGSEVPLLQGVALR